MSDMPEQPKTKELPAVPAWAAELVTSVKTGFAVVNERLDGQDKKLDKVVTEGIEANTRLTRIEDRVSVVERDVFQLEGRVGKASLAVRGASAVDMEHEAQLAQERTAREALASKVDSLTAMQETQLAILGRLDKVAKNPLVKTLAAMLLTAAITWLASHGVQVPR